MIPSVPPFEECLVPTWGVSWIEHEDVVAHRGFSNAALARAEHRGISRVTATSKPTFVVSQQLVRVGSDSAIRTPPQELLWQVSLYGAFFVKGVPQGSYPFSRP